MRWARALYSVHPDTNTNWDQHRCERQTQTVIYNILMSRFSLASASSRLLGANHVIVFAVTSNCLLTTLIGGICSRSELLWRLIAKPAGFQVELRESKGRFVQGIHSRLLTWHHTIDKADCICQDNTNPCQNHLLDRQIKSHFGRIRFFDRAAWVLVNLSINIDYLPSGAIVSPRTRASEMIWAT